MSRRADSPKPHRNSTPSTKLQVKPCTDPATGARLIDFIEGKTDGVVLEDRVNLLAHGTCCDYCMFTLLHSWVREQAPNEGAKRETPGGG